MIQYYLDLKKQITAVQHESLEGGQIQKIYSTAYYLAMAIRVPGKTWHLYLGRGAGQEGVWLHDAAPPSQLRRKDNFLEYFRRHLSSCTFRGLALDPSDRIVSIEYQKFGRLQALLLFWKGRQLYFLHHYQDAPDTPFKLLLSWRGKAITLPEPADNLYAYFTEVGRKTDMDHDLSSPHFASMTELLEQELKAANLKTLIHKPAFLERKRNNIEEDLRKARQWQKLQDVLDQQQRLEGVYELKVEDQRIKFSGDLNPFERRNLLFQKIKKLKRGESILQERLKATEAQLTGEQRPPTLTSAVPMVRPVWGKDHLAAQDRGEMPEQHSEFKLYRYENFQIGVGLSARGNDQLRSKWAKKDDWWIHLDGQKSAHVVIKTLNDSIITSDMLNAGASLVADHSDFKDEWIPIVYTQVKNLKGVSGAPGMVIYKKEKHIKCQRVDMAQRLRDLE
jgi:predicted ribosome quality control (RQC) complex YloA/Tae2 family protein